MPNFLENLFGPGSQPVQRNFDFEVAFDKDGNPVVLPLTGESRSLSAEGSLDRVGVTGGKFHFYSCGHPMTFPLGGQCVQCQRLSCLQCFWICFSCHCPICRRCGIVATTEQGASVTLCSSCHRALKRRRLIRLLLSPLVTFGTLNARRDEGGR